MATKFLNLSTDTTLGGVSPSDELAVSQKAIKTYVDNNSGGGSVAIDNSTITKNLSDEIQAVATLNANSAAGATNPIYDWVGTMAEYEAQSVATIHPDWVCYITDDIGGNATDMAQLAEDLNGKVDVGHEVIAFQAPTAANNYTWYRKYADGWVEQGGRSTGLDRTITLPVTMSNANYVIITDLVGAISWAGYSHAVQNITTTGFRCWYDGDSTDPSNWSWQVSGMAA